MAWAAWRTSWAKFERAFSLAACVVVGAGLFAFAVVDHVPGSADLREVSGRLRAYSFRETTEYGDLGLETLLTIDGARHRYWTDALSRGEAKRLFQTGAPVTIAFLTERSPTHGPVDGDAQKTYGLWVDGHVVRSVEQAIKRDTLALHVGFPLVGSVGFTTAFFIVRQNRKERERREARAAAPRRL